jgi:hypothetical protein
LPLAKAQSGANASPKKPCVEPTIGNDFITLSQRTRFLDLPALLSVWRNRPLSAIDLPGT